MRITRRGFLQAAAAAAAAGRLTPAALARLRTIVLSGEAPRVIWLQGQGCDGCAVSFLNSVHYATVDELLLNTLDVRFQNNLMAAAGDLAVSAVNAAAAEPGYVLIVEGAIPTGAGGKYCWLWPGTTMYDGLLALSQDAGFIIALGSCASYGGVTAGAPNPTEAKGVGEILVGDSRLINVPGCPAHPDWLVGTITYLLTNGHLPPMDADRRPLEYFGKLIHHNCHKRHQHCGAEIELAGQLSQEGCMEYLGCKGKKTYSDCYVRQWNSGGPGQYGVNWCIGSRSPCLGCVQPEYPDGMSPFFVYSPTPLMGNGPTGGADSPGARPQGTTGNDKRSP